MRRFASIIIALAACLAAQRLAVPEDPPATPLASGVVASPEPTAAKVGAEVLRKGGNAVDAAVAVAFALAVTFPEAGNLGGGGFLLVHVEGKPDVAIDARETAPAAATRDMFLDAKGDPVPDLSLRSLKASGVPGSVAGLALAHARDGKLPWKEVLAPAIALARDGFELDPKVERALAEERGSKEAQPGFARAFPPGRRLVQKELAATLERIAEKGKAGFYEGETARLVALHMKKGGGLITEADLSGYEAKVREPVVGHYRGCRVASMPPPSSGGVALVEMLNLAELFEPAKLGHNSTTGVHLVCEIEKRVFADRSLYLGDPGFFDVPVARLTDKAYAKERARGIALERRTDPASIQGGLGPREKAQTTHLSVVDRHGNAVAFTTTLNDAFGSGIVCEGAGFLLNNEMDDFSVKPGVPNMYGVTGGEANAIAPGKRMLSSMAPTFVYGKDGALKLVLGTPGGPTIFTTVFQVIQNRLEHDLPLDKAVAAPRFHHQWPPLAPGKDVVRVEKGIETKGLEDLGYTIERRRIGDVQAIEIDRAARRATGASDPRGAGAVAVE